MNYRNNVLLILVALVVAAAAAPVVMAQQTQGPKPEVPELYTIKGQFVRIAYNNEGWVTLGYRTANDSQGSEWMLLEAGVTVHKGVPDQKLTRASFSVKMPDGSLIPMASQREYGEAGFLRALNARGNTVRDSINYFPVGANRAFAMRFFSDPADRGALSYDQFDANWQVGSVGRIFFKLPEGKEIEPGQYWLSVKFAGSTVEAPFRIMTKEEEKYLKKNWKDIKKEHEAFINSELEKAKQKQ